MVFDILAIPQSTAGNCQELKRMPGWLCEEAAALRLSNGKTGTRMKQSFLTPYDLCKRWGKVVTPKTLANWRSLGVGPPYTKLQGRVVYSVEDIEAYELRKKKPGELPRAEAFRISPALR
jgi:hypothetical protein